MTKTGFTFTSLSEAEEAWATMRAYLFLGSVLNVFTGKEALGMALEAMDSIGGSVSGS